MTERLEIANRILARLAVDGELGVPFLRGSLADGRVDEYSDIDIGLRPATLSDTAAVESIVEIMYDQHAVEFHDWARSLLPGAAVVTFFLSDVPVFWNVDFEIVVPESLRTATRQSVPHDATAHDLKIWPLALKYAMRQAEDHRPEVTRFVARYVDGPGSWPELRRGLANALSTIEATAPERYSRFIARCWQTYRDLVTDPELMSD